MHISVSHTGMATALGASTAEVREQLLAGRSGTRDLSWYKYRDGNLPVGEAPLGALAAAVKADGVELSEDDSRATLLAIAVAKQAIASAKAATSWSSESSHHGLYLGSSLNTAEFVCRAHERYHIAKKVSVRTVFEGMTAMVAARLASVCGISGPCVTISSSCGSSTQAIQFAISDLLSGAVREALVVGVDSCFEVPFLDSWCCTRVLSRMSPAETAARPFCNTRRGFVYAEGAAALVLQATDTPPPFEIVAVGSNCGIEDLAAIRRDSVRNCIESTLDRAGLTAADMTFIHSAASGAVAGDLEEAAAIAEIFGNSVPVFAPKALTGNTFGAAGAIGVAQCIELARAGILPNNPHIFEADSEICGMIDCRYNSISLPAKGYALINSFGFGGINCALILRFNTSV